MVDRQGRPLLSRTYGGAPGPSFPTVALLSTVCGFADGVGMHLRRSAGDDDNSRVVFRRAPGGLLFVLVATDGDSSGGGDAEGHLFGLLRRCEDVVTLLSGRAALDCDARGNGPQKQKALMRAARPALDVILNEDRVMPCVVFDAAHVLPRASVGRSTSSYRSTFAAALMDLATQAGVQHAAAFARGLTVAATPAWDHLPAADRVALQVALTSFTDAAIMRDVPVYLPGTSPDTAHRLVVGTLVDGVQVAMLCGPEPGLSRAGQLMATLAARVGREALEAAAAAAAGGKGEEGEGWGRALPDEVEAAICVDATSSRAWTYDASVDETDGGGEDASSSAATGRALSTLLRFAMETGPLLRGGRTVDEGKTGEPWDGDHRGVAGLRGEHSLPRHSDVVDVQMVAGRYRLAAAVVDGGAVVKSIDDGNLSEGRVAVYAALDKSVPAFRAAKALRDVAAAGIA